MSAPTSNRASEIAHTRRFLADVARRTQVTLDQDIRNRDHLQQLRGTNPALVPDWKLTVACNQVERDRIEAAFAAKLLKALPPERAR
jgi:hypothetical protein